METFLAAGADVTGVGEGGEAEFFSALARALEMRVSAKDVMGPEAAEVAVVAWAGRASSSAVRALLADCAVVEGGGRTKMESGRGVTGIIAGSGGWGAPEGEGVDILML